MEEGLRRLEVVLVRWARQDRRLGERRGSPVKGDRERYQRVSRRGRRWYSARGTGGL